MEPLEKVRDGKTQQLIIYRAKLDDNCRITAKTNSDDTSCTLEVKGKRTNPIY
jgi:hypothetical protein